jgi:transposase
MEILYPRCGGLDGHKRTVVACLLVPGPDGTPTQQLRTFGTMTSDLLALSDWLAGGGRLHPRGHGVNGGVLEAHV